MERTKDKKVVSFEEFTKRKLVIYLYPTEESKVNVKVLDIDFKVTIPEYPKNGWTVMVKPSGELLSLHDGKVYSYLFWEGTNGRGLSADSGFIVEKKDLLGFLGSSLNKKGLNEKERADFIEFNKCGRGKLYA